MAQPEVTKQRQLIRWPVIVSVILASVWVTVTDALIFFPLRFNDPPYSIFRGSLVVAMILLALFAVLLLCIYIISCLVCLFRRRFLAVVSFVAAIIVIPAVGLAEERLQIFDLYFWQVLLNGGHLTRLAHDGNRQGGPVCKTLYQRYVSLGVLAIEPQSFVRLTFDDSDELARPAADRSVAWRERCADIIPTAVNGYSVEIRVSHLLGHFYLVHLDE